MKSQFQAVIFDFDYTLADSSAGIIACTNFALDQMGFQPVAEESIRQTIGLSLSEMFLRFVGSQQAGQAKEFVRLFVQRADEVMVDQTIIFETVPEIVKALKQCGVALGIVSTKYRYRIETVLQRENLLSLFNVIVGGEDVSNHKPDPEGLVRAMDQLGHAPSDLLYVGDSVTDAETAMRAAVPFAPVLSGVTPKSDFDGWPVYRILESLTDLPHFVGCEAKRSTIE